MSDKQSRPQSLSHVPLGQATPYVATYDPAQLCAVPRANRWQGVYPQRPFSGVDIWNAYEVSWLNARGLPQVAVAEFRVPCDSANIIESKSFKLYLNSFNLSRFADADEVRGRMISDLSACAGSAVSVELQSLSTVAGAVFHTLPGTCIDDQDIDIDHYEPSPELLSVGKTEVSEQLHSHLLKSNCPVTGQPDWASVLIDYQGPAISHENLLRYLVSFREHGGFHEDCVEQIFLDLMQQCRPQRLSVYARYLRRGGLDINPFRSTESDQQVANLRLLRQ